MAMLPSGRSVCALLTVATTWSVATALTAPLFMTDVSSSSSMTSLSHLFVPSERRSHYNADSNVAQYLVDLHDNKATFDFCGGMMFQLE
jgi:hypothetical protein